MHRVLTLASAIVIVANPVVAEEAAEQAQAAESERVCVFARDIDNFDALDNRYVYVEARRDQQYLFTLDPGCFGLRSANVIAISDTTSRVCSNSFGRLTYRERGTGLRYCRIRDIEMVADKAAARALVQARKDEQQKKKDKD